MPLTMRFPEKNIPNRLLNKNINLVVLYAFRIVLWIKIIFIIALNVMINEKRYCLKLIDSKKLYDHIIKTLFKQELKIIFKWII